MIRHIVSWKLAADTEEQRAADAEAIRAALEPLVEELDGIVSLSVHRNAVAVENNWDLVLVGDYVDEEALRAYIVHPSHQDAVAIVKPRVSARSAVDFEV